MYQEHPDASVSPASAHPRQPQHVPRLQTGRLHTGLHSGAAQGRLSGSKKESGVIIYIGVLTTGPQPGG